MKKDIRSKVKRFLTSEVGQTSVRAPLVLGVAGGAILLSQILHTPSAAAEYECSDHDDCGSGGSCREWCTTDFNGNCIDWHSTCIYP